jgi:hypothetical protein
MIAESFLVSPSQGIREAGDALQSHSVPEAATSERVVAVHFCGSLLQHVFCFNCSQGQVSVVRGAQGTQDGRPTADGAQRPRG